MKIWDGRPYGAAPTMLGLMLVLFSACSNNQAPSADAGDDQTIFVGETVILDGSGSSDPEGDALAVSWAFESQPPGSQAIHSDPGNFSSSFVADVPGTYVVRLSVDDGEANSGGALKFQSIDDSGDTVTISAVLPMTLTGINIDYDPEVRCSDDNWATLTPVACNPQLAFTCPANNELSFCPARCQDCFNTDLSFLKQNLGVSTITLYQPNYYALTAAQAAGLKVILGLFNDSVLALATPDSGTTSCTYAGSPALCGSKVMDSLIDGACGATTPWEPSQFCTGSSYITAFKSFFDNGTVVAVQLGNEILSSPVNGALLTKAQVLAAAKTLRDELNKKSYTAIPVVVSLVAGMEKDFCENGAPPPNVDWMAAHPYCDFVASVPPTWPLESGVTTAQAAQACAQEVWKIFSDTAVASCGAAQSFIGETGYNTGCPNLPDEPTHLAVAEAFYPDMIKLACDHNTPLFFFDYADACPESGCLPGCPGQPVQGNGYFGIYYTENYQTKGNLVLKFPSVPSLSCP